MNNKQVLSTLVWITTLLLMMAASACSSKGKGVATGESTSYVKGDDSGFVRYVDRGEENEVRYIKKDGRLIRMTPERPSPQKAAVEQENLSPMAAEFKAASTAEEFAAFVNKYKPAELAFVAVQRIARPLLEAGNWEAALEVYNKYQQDFPIMTSRFNKIITLLGAPEKGVELSNLGSAINTHNGEYNPVIAANGKKLYLARDCGECSGGEDIYVAVKEGENWGKAQKIDAPILTSGHETPLAISADGNSLAIFGNYPGSFGRGDIFYTEKNQSGWSGVKHYPAPINTEYFESNAMYASDGKAILFVSERPGGMGGFHKKDEFFHGNYSGNTDIYVYIKQSGGQGRVINLGETINTPYSEYSPYLHPDGKTLYFSSDGHYGLGGLDVYKSTRLSDDSWTAWSEPVNLGKEINGPYNDWGYQFSTDGRQAYFAKKSAAAGYGNYDIYTTSIPEEVQPEPVITISGTVTDPEGNPLAATIRWNDLTRQKEIGEARTDPETGEYFIALPSGGTYGYYAEKEGYMGQSEHFDIREEWEFNEFVVDIVLYPIETPVEIEEEMPAEEEVEEQVTETISEEPIRMNNIFFEFNVWKLRPESFLELDRWVKMLKENPQLKLEIHGHTDHVGTEEYNRNLSEKRARSVANYLIEQGISPDRLTTKGFGESQPVATNETEEGRQQNRRVEVKIINNR